MKTNIVRKTVLETFIHPLVHSPVFCSLNSPRIDKPTLMSF